MVHTKAMDPRKLPLLTDQVPPELLVHEEPEACPYLPDEVAKMPLRLPVRALRPSELDTRLSQGDRRHGLVLYRPTCPTCHACEAIRINATEFEFTGSHRRALRKGQRTLVTTIGHPVADPTRVDLYDKHKHRRGLSREHAKATTVESLSGFLVDRCCESLEFRYHHKGKLVGVSIADVGRDSLSAVYCYYDPDYKHLGIGTYSILKQLAYARAIGFTYLYLGLYIGENAHMRYKGRFRPHERLIDGVWQRFVRD